MQRFEVAVAWSIARAGIGRSFGEDLFRVVVGSGRARPSECRVARSWTVVSRSAASAAMVPVRRRAEGVGDVVEVEPLGFGGLVGFVVGFGDGAVDDVEPVGVAAAGDGDVALFETGQVGRVVAGDAVGGALDAVAGAGVAVLEPTGRQVGARDADRALPLEVDRDLPVLGVQRR